MTIEGIDPKAEKPSAWRRFWAKLDGYGLWIFIVPILLIYWPLYGLYYLLVKRHKIPRVQLNEAGGVITQYRRKKRFNYREIEIVSAAYNTPAYLRDTNYAEFSFLTFHFAEETVKIFHNRPIAQHEKVLKMLSKQGVRIEGTRNGKPSRFGRKIKQPNPVPASAPNYRKR